MLLSPFVEDIVDLVIEEGVKVVTTGAGNPSKYMTRFHDAGITVIPVNFFFFVAVVTLSHLFKVINFIKCKPFFYSCQDLSPIYRRKVYLSEQISS